MPDLADQDILDLVATSLPNLGSLKFEQVAQELTNYEIMGRVLREDKITYDSPGVAVNTNIMLRQSGAARMTQIHEVDNVNIADVMGKTQVPWRHTDTSYGFSRLEVLENAGEGKIVDLLTVRRTDAMISLVELLEDQGWGIPTGPSDKKNVWGIPYWIQKNASEGFFGGNASGFSDMAGIDASVETRHRNWTAQYTNVSKTDLIRKMRKGYRHIRFISPLGKDNGYAQGNSGDMYRIYCGETPYAAFEEVGEAQNENLGKDIASMDGMIVFRGNPIIYVPQLDGDAQSPVYMLNFNKMGAMVAEGDYLHESEVMRMPLQHNDFQRFVDLTWNINVRLRRNQAVYATA